MRLNLSETVRGGACRTPFCPIGRGILPRALWAVLFGGMVWAQAPLTFQNTLLQPNVGYQQVLTADFNGDGNADLVFMGFSQLTVMLGNGDGAFQAPIQTPLSIPFLWMAVGDFNNDGKIDVALIGQMGFRFQTLNVSTYLGIGDGTFSAPLSSGSVGTPYAPGFAANLAVGDVNRDGILDLIGDGIVALGNGDGTFMPFVMLEINCTGGVDFALADFNGDGNPDLVVLITQLNVLTNIYSAMAWVCLGNGKGTFPGGLDFYTTQTETASGTTQLPAYMVTTGDFNGDGRTDVLVSSHNAPGSFPNFLSYAMVPGNGDGTFGTAVSSGPFQLDAVNYPKPLVFDMNGDGKADLVQIEQSPGIVIFLSNGDGTFTQAASISPGYTPNSIAVADFNNDGLPDIVATSGSGSSSILINSSRGIDSVVNAASLASGQPVAPGSLVAIFGAGIGPAAGVGGSGQNSLAGVSVTFNGIPAPLLYVSARQINAQVPWEVSGVAEVAVTVNGAPVAQFPVATASIAPGVFTTAGQALALHPDGTLVSVSHPAAAGETLTVYANGLGPVSPSIADGAVSSDAVRMVGSTPVFIGGVRCNVTFAGLSSTLLGVNQLSVVVPAGVHGVVPLLINAGGIITSAAVTIAIQ
jgi:uncharacterized protein (TIGR03437 family)